MSHNIVITHSNYVINAKTRLMPTSGKDWYLAAMFRQSGGFMTFLSLFQFCYLGMVLNTAANRFK